MWIRRLRVSMAIKTVLYVSRAKVLRAMHQLRTLVPLARFANQRCEIASVLRFDGRNYTQMLEGPSRAIDVLMARIAMDKRHTLMRILYDRSIQERSWLIAPLHYLYDETCRGWTSDVVDSQRVLSRVEVQNVITQLVHCGTISDQLLPRYSEPAIESDLES